MFRQKQEAVLCKLQCEIAAIVWFMDFILPGKNLLLSAASLTRLPRESSLVGARSALCVPASCMDGISLQKTLIPLIYLSPQKQACMLIRNLVSRSRDFSQPILEMGAENLITEARAAHKDCDDVAKAALRDLGCKVELRELWTGQKGSLAQ